MSASACDRRRDLSPAGYQANRTLGVLSKMFNLAELWRSDGSNPCLHVKRYKEDKRERFLIPEEFNRLGRVLDEISVDGSEIPSAVAALRLLMLTRSGCRRSGSYAGSMSISTPASYGFPTPRPAGERCRWLPPP